MTKDVALPTCMRVPRGRRLLAKVAALRRNQGGSAAIEFAIVAPFFFFLMFVIAETALIFVAEQVMDNAVFDAARLIRTGQVQGEFSTEDFRDEVCNRMSVFVDCNDGEFYLDVNSYDSFAEMVLVPPLDDDDEFQEPGEYDFGEEEDIIVVRAYYKWPTNPIWGNLSLQNTANGKRLIGSFAAFRNEPFGLTE